MECVVGVLQILSWILEPTVTNISIWKWLPTRWNDFTKNDGNIPITIVLQAKHPTRGVTHLQKWNQLQGDLSGLSHLPFCQKFQWRQNLRKYTFLISPLSDYKTMFCLQILEMPNVSNSYFVKWSEKDISNWVLIHVCTTFCNLVQITRPA